MIGDVPSATASLHWFLQHAEIITITGYSIFNVRKGASQQKAIDLELPTGALPFAQSRSNEAEA